MKSKGGFLKPLETSLSMPLSLLVLCLMLYKAEESTEILGVSLKIQYSFLKCMSVSNACNMDFHLFIVLGDEFNNQYLTLYLGHVYLLVLCFVF